MSVICKFYLIFSSFFVVNLIQIYFIYIYIFVMEVNFYVVNKTAAKLR